MNLGIDVMGGDSAPKVTIEGVKSSIDKLSENDKLFLFGSKDIVTDYLSKFNIPTNKVEVIDCKYNIEMGDDPVRSFFEKKDSSITKGFYFLKEGKIDSFSSAGNTGAMMVGATQVIGVIEGVIRPVIASYYPNNKGKNSFILDVGLNPEPKPEVLYQYAEIGHIYCKNVINIKNPKVGLLNIGEEESKGNANTKQAHQLLKASTDLNFIGNVEGSDLYNADIVDVIVCDGFTGNVVLKQAEAFYSLLNQRGICDSYFDNYNYENYGGTPILGVKQPVIIGHGKSTDIAIQNMILLSKQIVESNVSQIIKKHFNHGTN